MKATLLPDLLTKCTPKDVAAAFRSALETLTGKTPSLAHLAILVAQSALESGRWKSMHCWNFGNVKASPTYEGFYCQFRCNEVIGGKLLWFDPPHPQCNFRAFQSIEAGAFDHIRFLSQSKRYIGAWHAAEQGDPARFVRALKLAGYFTADEGPYLSSVVSLFNEYTKLLTRDTDPAPPLQHRPVLRLGSSDRGDASGPVHVLQQLLSKHDWPVKIDGEFGTFTEAAVRLFQKDRELVVDGRVGPKTWNALGGG